MNTSHSDYRFDLGTHCPAFVVTNDEAAAWFATGLSWLYGFNHEEAIGCFQNAARADDGFALAWWGIVISSGPSTNKPWEWLTMLEKEQSLAACHGAIAEAMSRTAYADAMIPVYESYGDDPDIAALYIDSQIMLTPWQIYDVDKRAPNPEAREREIQAALERSLAGTGADHIGVLHFDIHVQEMSPTPEKALPSARRPQELAPPDAGHLQHMPSHIHALVGDFDEATRCSRLSIATDKRFMANLHRTPFYRTLVCHDIHMLMFAGMQTGNLADAADAAIVMAEILENVLVHPPVTHMDMTLKGYYATIAYVDVRFGRWQQIAGREFTGDPAFMPVSHAIHHQARAVALAALGRHHEADMAAADFDAARARLPAGYAYFNNQAHDILSVGAAMMRGRGQACLYQAACRRCRGGACRSAAAGGPACDKFMFLPRQCRRVRHGLTRLYL